MKKQILIALLLVTLDYFCVAQQPQTDKPLPESCYDIISNSIKISPYPNNNRTLVWNWDTVISYNRIGLMERSTQSFNISGTSKTQLIEIWKNNNWVDSLKLTFTYNGSGKKTEELTELWQNNTWLNSIRKSTIYDSAGIPTSFLAEKWQNNVWGNTYKSNYTYDSNGKLLDAIQMKWENNIWVNYTKWTNNYDRGGVLLSGIYMEWKGSLWQNLFKTTYTYDINWLKINELGELWVNNIWETNYRCTYTHDISSNCTEELYEGWESGSWYNMWRNVFTYDSNGNSVTGKSEFDSLGYWSPNMYQLFLYLNGKTQYFTNSNMYRYQAKFISINTGIKTELSENNDFKIFPIPTSSKLTIINLTICKDAVLSLFNSQGINLFQIQLNQKMNEIDVSRLMKGLYFVEIISNDKRIVTKIIKN